MESPNTLPEWREYFSSLNDEKLFSQAQLINMVAFFDRMRGEGLTILEIVEILKVMRRVLAERGISPPGGGMYNYDLPPINVDVDSLE